MAAGAATVLSVNVGPVREVTWQGKRIRTAFFREPVDGRIALTEHGLEGDERAWKQAIGDPEHALYAYAAEDSAWWEEQLGRELAAAAFGENLTVAGLDLTGAPVGQRWELPDAVLEVAKPRIPCRKLAVAMDDPSFVKRFAAAGRPGTYLRVLRAGSIAAGDAVRVRPPQEQGETIGEVFAAALNRSR